MIEYFWDQSDEIFLGLKWWNIFGTKRMKYFLDLNDEIFMDQNDEIFLWPKWWNILVTKMLLRVKWWNIFEEREKSKQLFEKSNNLLPPASAASWGY